MKVDAYYFDIQDKIEKKYYVVFKKNKLGVWMSASEIAASIGVNPVTQVETRIIVDILKMAYKNKTNRFKRTSKGQLFYMYPFEP